MSYKFLSRSYDITDEVTSGNVEKVAELVSGMDDRIKQAFIPSLEETATRDEADFALVLFDKRNGYRNKYATFTKELTTLNLKLFEQKLDELPDEFIKTAATHFKAAANHYKIDFPDKLNEYVDESLTSKYVDVNSIDKKAYYLKTAKKKCKSKKHAVASKQKYPIDNEKMVKKAYDYFNNYSRELSVPDRIEYARNLYPELKQYGLEPTALIDKLAHIDSKTFNPDFKYHIRSRKTMTHDDETRQAYDALLEKTAEWTPTKVAMTLNKIDRKANLHYHYDKKIEEPVSATLGMKKMATYEIDGKVFSQDEYNDMVGRDLSSWVDVDTHTALKSEEGPDVFKSLPKPIREGILSEVL